MALEIDTIARKMKEAVLDVSAWESALDCINAFVDGSGAVLLSTDERLRYAPRSHDMKEMMEDYFSNGWYANDIREKCIPLLLENGIVCDHEVLDTSIYDDYHSNFIEKHGRKWFAGVVANINGDSWCLALQRSPSKGAFLEADLPRLTATRLLLQETASYARLVSRQWFDGAISALEGEDTIAIFLDRCGRIVEMSAAANLMIKKSRGTPGGGPFGISGSLRALEEILQTILIKAPRQRGLSGRIPFEFDGKAYLLEAASLLGQASLIFAHASVLVKIYPRPRSRDDILKTKFGLTSSEVRVALALADGMNVEAMADAFQVSRNTIRAQLKTTYAKTQMNGQARLASFVVRLN